MDYYGLLAQANLQNCDPMDSACVSNNVAKEAAVEDLWAKYQSTGVPDNTVLTFAPQTAQEVREFYNPTDLANSGNVVDTRGIMTATIPSNAGAPPPLVPVTNQGAAFSSLATCGAQPTVGTSFGLPNPFDLIKLSAWQTCMAKAQKPVPIPLDVPAIKTAPSSGGGAYMVNQQGQTVINSSGAVQPIPQATAQPTGPWFGFSISQIPVWGWAAAAGFALLALGGSRG
jgi:hypothetical protein